jgi:hypothetical protein
LATLPWPAFDVTAGGHRHRFHRQVLFLESLQAPLRKTSPTLDGRTNDWPGTPGLQLTRGGQPPAGLQAAFDAKSLYLVVDVPVTEEPLSEDSVFHDQLQIGFAPRSGATDFGGETLRLGLQGSGAAVGVGDRTPGRRVGTTLPGVRAVDRTAGGRAVFELAIPRKLLPSLAGTAKGRLVLSVSFPLPNHVEAEPAEPKPGSFAYQVRYGGDALVPVHFVELALKSDKEESRDRS